MDASHRFRQEARRNRWWLSPTPSLTPPRSLSFDLGFPTSSFSFLSLRSRFPRSPHSAMDTFVWRSQWEGNEHSLVSLHSFFFSSDFVLWFGSLCEFPCSWCWLYCVLLIELLFGGNRRLDFLFLRFFLYCFLLLIVIYFDLLVRASWGLDDLICAICFVLTAVINSKMLVVHSFVYLDILTNLMIIYILNWGLDYLLFAILIGSDDLMIVIFYKFRWFCSWNSCSFLLFLYTAAVN